MRDRKVARETGLEPAASAVTGRRSNQLSYSRKRDRSIRGKPNVSQAEGRLATEVFQAGSFMPMKSDLPSSTPLALRIA